jgi:hypothetical protein
MARRRQANKTLVGFTGLDLRRTPEAVDPIAFRVANNIDLTTGGGFKARDQLRLYVTVDSASVGLYVIGNDLHVALPYRTATAIPRPLLPDLVYDLIGDSATAAYSGTGARVAAAASWHGQPYLCIEKNAPGSTTGAKAYEHHFIPLQPATLFFSATANGTTTLASVTPDPSTLGIIAGATVWVYGNTTAYRVVSVGAGSMVLTATVPTGAVNGAVMSPKDTRVGLPFTPGAALFLAAEKVWANEQFTGDTWFCSSVNGPSDWAAEADAGFLPTSVHSGGDQKLHGYGLFNGKLAIFYETTVQQWTIDPDPANHELYGVTGGAGTQQPGSIANVMGDLVYFAQGGFRSLKAVVTTGQIHDGDVGARIQPETRLLDFAQLPRPLSLWSPSRAQYLCALGTTVYVFTASPTSGVVGWTKYTLPWALDAMVELEGKVYVRPTGVAEIHVFDPAATTESGFSWTAQFAYYDGEDHTIPKFWRVFDYAADGAAALSYLIDPAAPAQVVNGPAINTTLFGRARTFPMVISNHVATVFSGTQPFSCDRFTYWFDLGNL